MREALWDQRLTSILQQCARGLVGSATNVDTAVTAGSSWPGQCTMSGPPPPPSTPTPRAHRSRPFVGVVRYDWRWSPVQTLNSSTVFWPELRARESRLKENGHENGQLCPSVPATPLPGKLEHISYMVSVSGTLHRILLTSKHLDFSFVLWCLEYTRDD